MGAGIMAAGCALGRGRGAVLCEYRPNGVRLPIIAFVMVFAPSLLMSFMEPVIERLWVKPDELRIEKPYLRQTSR